MNKAVEDLVFRAVDTQEKLYQVEEDLYYHIMGVYSQETKDIDQLGLGWLMRDVSNALSQQTVSEDWIKEEKIKYRAWIRR